MGLTIHYRLKSDQKDTKKAAQTVHQVRQLALDLPFEEVSDIVDLRGEECDFESRREELKALGEKGESLFWLLIQAQESVPCPWNKEITIRVRPKRIIGFTAWPGHGCEPANLGLCQFPEEIEIDYTPEDDQRFRIQRESKSENGHVVSTWSEFSWTKWNRHCKRKHGQLMSVEQFVEKRMVPTGLAGWSWESFCKTQYAAEPSAGSVPNFLRCHISVITLLERIAKLPGMKVRIDDEGNYGPSRYGDDDKEARAAGRMPTYTWHKGRYSPAALAKEVGEWNALMAGFAGALSDALAKNNMTLEARIKSFQDFEHLEFRGRNSKYLGPFLQAMKALTPTVEGETA